MERGSYLEIDGRPAVRFQRTYPHPPARVWAAISEPDGLAHWFPSAVRIEPRAGGEITFSDDPNLEPSRGRVLSFDPPRRFSFTWGQDELDFSLEAVEPDRCRLTFTHLLAQRDTAARNAAGWSVCLAELTKHLDGQSADGPHAPSAQPWRPHYEAYLAAGLPSGAPIPDHA